MQNNTVYWIEGDGIGAELWKVVRPIVDTAVQKDYGTSINWIELLAGDKALEEKGTVLPEETLATLKSAKVAIKGPLGTPVGTGMRSLNVMFRQVLDLYACVRPIKHYAGIESPVKHPEKLNVTVFRENTEDVYAGIEYESQSPEAKKLADFLHEAFGVEIFPDSAIGIKPMSPFRSKRLVRAAIQYALNSSSDRSERNVTLVHKGNIMKFTEGGFRKWGYEVAEEEFADKICSEAEAKPGRITIKDRIADAMFQEVLLSPEYFDVIATPNLNGDYLSDALAAQVGGLGMAPGVNLSNELAFFEATHGTAPAIAGKDMANPCSLLLSAAMMLEHMNWPLAAERIRKAIEKNLNDRLVTIDLAKQMTGSKVLGTTAFGQRIGELL